MGCGQCKRRQRLLLTCKSCTKEFCTACIQLEVHTCPALADKQAFEKENLAKKLVKVTAPKIDSF